MCCHSCIDWDIIGKAIGSMIFSFVTPNLGVTRSALDGYSAVISNPLQILGCSQPNLPFFSADILVVTALHEGALSLGVGCRCLQFLSPWGCICPGDEFNI